MRITKRAEAPKTFDEPTELAAALDQFTTAKKESERWSKIASEQQAAIIKLMEQAGKKDDVVSVYGRDLKVTIVAAETVKFNESQVLRILGKRAFSKVCDMKLNKTLLKDAIGRGEIDPQMIAEASSIVTNAPYVRVSVATSDETTEDDK